MSRQQQLQQAFASTFGGAPTFAARAPGRVNLIGEHTDYNDGFCLPMAIERDVLVVGRPTTDGVLRAMSLEQDGVVEAPLNSLAKNAEKPWAFTIKMSLGRVLLGASWEHLGSSWGHVGVSWGHFGSIFGVYVGLC